MIVFRRAEWKIVCCFVFCFVFLEDCLFVRKYLMSLLDKIISLCPYLYQAKSYDLIWAIRIQM